MLQDAVVLLNSNGESLNLGRLTVVREDDGFQLLSAPSSLAQNASYQLLSRLAEDCQEGVGRASCVLDVQDAQVVAQFTTGHQRDDEPPQILAGDGSAEVELGFSWTVAPRN